MNKREYLKYNRDMHDINGKPIKVGDTVIINNHYGVSPIIGTVSHFTESNKVAVNYKEILKTRTFDCTAYREPETIIKVKI